MEERKPKSVLGISIGISVLLLLLVPAGRRAWNAWRTANAMPALRAELDHLIRQADGRSGERPVLRGTPVPGKAWEKYAEFCQGKPADREKVLPLFREGLLRTDGGRLRDWKDPEPYLSTGFAMLVHRESQDLSRAGQPAESLNLQLDLLQFSNDLARNGTVEEWQDADRLRAGVLLGLRIMLSTWRLPAEDLKRFANELELLDRGFPSLHDALVNAAVARGLGYVELSTSKSLTQDDRPPSPDTEGVLILAAFREELEGMRRIGAVEAAPWKDALAVAEEVKAGLARSGNPVLRRHAELAADDAIALLKTSREHRAQLRLLRIVCARRADGALLDLGDPFGDRLRVVVDPSGAFSAWSRGPDGVDDGGKGDWTSYAGPDLVIRLKK